MLAGEGINRETLEEFVIENNAAQYDHFLGNYLDVQNYYSASHVCVYSSPMEVLPIVLLEALSFGVSIAATDSFPGVREILGDNENGLIVLWVIRKYLQIILQYYLWMKKQENVWLRQEKIE